MRQLKPSVMKANGKLRLGQGFSLLELKKAGIGIQKATKLEIPTDMNRKTAHDSNVELVKAFVAKAAEAKPKIAQKAEPTKESKKKAKN